MIETFITIIKDSWEWRAQIFRLARFDLRRRSRGAVLGWFWLLFKPAVYVFCFWFALDIGLRAGRGGIEGAPYFLWLCTGLIPWFFMQDMISVGSDALRQYPYLVTKLKFPLCAISLIRSTATLLLQFILQAILFCIYFITGMQLDIHLIQVPFILILMYLFWSMFSIACSLLSGVSRDFANLIKTLSLPLFWLSGVIFDLSRVTIDWIQTVMLFNPVTFFANSFRMAFCSHQWIWEDPAMLGVFAGVFLLTLIIMIWVYKRLSQEVADVF